MEVDQTREINHANVFTTNNEEIEEYEEVESCTEGVGEDEQTTIPEDQLARCRFCWGTSASFENPLFKSCNCAGSVGYIHFSCLRNWLDVKK